MFLLSSYFWIWDGCGLSIYGAYLLTNLIYDYIILTKYII